MEEDKPRTGRLVAFVRRWWVDALLVVVVLTALSWWQTRNVLGSGEPVPDVVFRTLDGDPVALDDLTDGTVLLHFWAVWCGACRVEVGSLNRLDRGLPPSRRLIAVALDDRGARAVADFMQTQGVDYEVVLADRRVIEAFGVQAFPTNFYVGPDRRIHRVTVGVSGVPMMRYRLWRASWRSGS